MNDKQTDLNQKNAELKKENKRLKRELERKEKALSEAAGQLEMASTFDQLMVINIDHPGHNVSCRGAA